jgi:hypothetical protein
VSPADRTVTLVLCARVVRSGARTTGPQVCEEGGTAMSNNGGTAASSGAIYGLGIFGALVYFWQQADTFWEYALALLQGVFWPAFMVYEAFSALD